jgi:hypothetical protein
MAQLRQVTLITGASEGIGLEFAHVFARNGHDLALVARRGARLEELADSIAATGRPRPLCIPLDLAAPEAPAQLQASLQKAGAQVACLVNNAGFGLLGDFAVRTSDEQLNMIDLNIRALTALTHVFLADVRAARGGILNVASVAAFAPGPGMAVYYATKAYVLSFSEALREEVKEDGVRVLALCPGPVATGFRARAGIAADASSSRLYLTARQTAEAGYRAFMAGKGVLAPGLLDKFLATMLRVTPHALLLPRIAATQRARRA